MSLKIYQHHDFEFGLVFTHGDDETSVMYYPDNGLFLIPTFGLEYNSFSEVIDSLQIEGETSNLEEVFTYYFDNEGFQQE